MLRILWYRETDFLYIAGSRVDNSQIAAENGLELVILRSSRQHRLLVNWSPSSNTSPGPRPPLLLPTEQPVQASIHKILTLKSTSQLGYVAYLWDGLLPIECPSSLLFIWQGVCALELVEWNVPQ